LRHASRQTGHPRRPRFGSLPAVHGCTCRLPLTVAARCLCAHDEPSTINGGAARLALQTRNIVLKILASQSETQKKFFRATIFHFRGVARLALQTRSARTWPRLVNLQHHLAPPPSRCKRKMVLRAEDL